MNCPTCGHDNIPGVDACGQCSATLAGLVDESEVEESITRHPIMAIATKDPISVPAFTTVRAAISCMMTSRIGCVLVEEHGSVAGLFTERDVLNLLAGDRAALDAPVSRYMTPAPQTVAAEDSIAYALHLTSVGGYRHLPVADASGQAVAIISTRDILRFLSIRFGAIRGRRG